MMRRSFIFTKYDNNVKELNTFWRYLMGNNEKAILVVDDEKHS